MKQTAPAPDPAHRRVLVVWAALLAVAALLVFAFTPPSRAPFDAKVAELRAAGYAMSMEDAWRDAPPDDENAALEIEAAWNELVVERGRPESWDVTGPWDLALTEPWYENASAERLAALASSLGGIRPFFDRVETAATKPALWVREGRDASGLPDGRGVRLLQDVHRLVEAQSLANGDPRRCLSASVAALRLANAVGLGSRFRGGYGDAGLRGTRQVVERRSLPAAEVRAACDALLCGGSDGWVQRAARDEVWWTAEYLDGYLRGKVVICMATPTGTWARSRIGRAFRGISRGHDHSDPPVEECVDCLERTRRIAGLPSSGIRDLHRFATEIDAEGADSELMGRWPGQVRTHARRESARALARVALAAAEFRERERRWPESLDALAPMFPEGVPVDPCDGRPFDYVIADGTARLSARGFVPEAPPRGEEQDEAWRRQQALVWAIPDR